MGTSGSGGTPLIKLLISMLLGVMGFFLAPYGIGFRFDDLTVNIPWSILFPILAAAAYGPWHALSASLAGGALYPFLLWPLNGWPNLTTTLCYTIFFVAVGIASQPKPWPKFKNQTLRLLLVTFVFALILVVYYIYVFEAITKLNPPFWSINAVSNISRHYLYIFLVKDFISFALIAFAASTMLRMPIVRGLLLLKPVKHFIGNDFIMLATLTGAILIWIAIWVLTHLLVQDVRIIYGDVLQLVLYIILVSSFTIARIIMFFSEGYQVFKADITAKEGQLRTLISNIPGVVFQCQVNDGFKLIFISANIEALTGYRAEEFLMGRVTYGDLTHPDDRLRVLAQVKTSIRNLTPYEITYRLRGAKGDWRWITERGMPQPDGQSNAIYLDGVNFDNTNQYETQLELRESEERYRMLYETANDSIFLIKNGVIIDCNRRSFEMFDLPRTTLVGITLSELSPVTQPDGMSSHAKAEEYIQRALGGESLLFNWTHLRSSRNEFEAEVSLNLLMLSNESIVLAVVRDISERVRLEREAQQNIFRGEENERARVAKELHDGIGPLLSTCKIYLHTMGLAQNSNEIQGATVRVTQLLDDALASIREISNNLSPHLVKNFGLINALMNFTERVAFKGKFNLSLDIGSKRFPEMLETSLYRVLTELINNTIKYANAQNIAIAMQCNQNMLMVRYNDDGVGFDLPLVMSKPNGHGLQNIRMRVQGLGGVVMFNSRPGEGVDVIITIRVNCEQ